MAKPAITIVQSFLYRGQPEEFSNKYHFLGPAPGDDTSWEALTSNLVDALRAFNTSAVTFHRAYGYNDGDQPSVWSYDWTVPGPPPAGNITTPTTPVPPGDAAAWLRFDTTKRNSKGKMVYCRKYFHGIHQQNEPNHDLVDTSQEQYMTAFGHKCIDGTISSVFRVCTPDGHPASNPVVGTFLTTRTLKRRGKRPPT
jgi:hypothetical protein